MISLMRYMEREYGPDFREAMTRYEIASVIAEYLWFESRMWCADRIERLGWRFGCWVQRVTYSGESGIRDGDQACQELADLMASTERMRVRLDFLETSPEERNQRRLAGEHPYVD